MFKSFYFFIKVSSKNLLNMSMNKRQKSIKNIIFIKSELKALRDGSGADRVRFVNKIADSPKNIKFAKWGDIIHVRVLSLLPKVGRTKHKIKKNEVYRAFLTFKKKPKSNTDQITYEPFAIFCSWKPIERY